MRGSTQLAENMPPAEFSRLINRYYNAATWILFETSAMVEKPSAMRSPVFTPLEWLDRIMRATGHHHSSAPWITVGTGVAYVGAINSDSGVTDIAILGDAAYIGARLASQAGAGEIHISQAAGLDPSGVEIRQLTLKGRTEPVEVWVLSQ